MAHIGIVAVSRKELGGTFQYTLSMIDALRRIAKNRYTLYTPSDNRSYDDLGLPIRPLPSLAATVLGIAGVRLMGKRSGSLFAEVDKVVAPTYTTRLLASQRPFVFTLHDMQERYYPEYFTYAQRLWRHVANKSLSGAADKIICESDHVKNDIHRFLDVDWSKIAVIPAPPILSFTPEQAASVERDLAFEKTELPGQFIFYPAQFFPHKNHLRLIEAFAQVARTHADCHLVLTGQKRYDFDRVMKKIRHSGLQNRVTHLGYVDANTLAVVYMHAALVVIPTLFESISIPIYEAFRMGVPVCASNVVALPEQIGDAGLLFDPLSIVDMAEKISYLLDNPAVGERLAAIGRQRIASLTADRYAEQLESLLDRLGWEPGV